MKERVGDAHVQGLGRLGGDVQARRVVVVGPFHQPPIQGGGTQPRADEHEDPGNGLELGLAGAEADVAVLAEDDEQRTHHESQEDHQHGGGQEVGGGLEELAGHLFRARREGGQGDHGEEDGNDADDDQQIVLARPGELGVRLGRLRFHGNFHGIPFYSGCIDLVFASSLAIRIRLEQS
ncbi:hypothetical protein D3C81_1647380 [compost metagenome]